MGSSNIEQSSKAEWLYDSYHKATSKFPRVGKKGMQYRSVRATQVAAKGFLSGKGILVS